MFNYEHPRWKYKVAQIPEGASETERWLAAQYEAECQFSHTLWMALGEARDEAKIKNRWFAFTAGIALGGLLASAGYWLSRVL